MEEKLEYVPIYDLDKIDPRMWIDRSVAILSNALHKYQCTGDRSHFENQEVYDEHYNLLHYMIKKKELNTEIIPEMVRTLIGKIFINILVKGYKVHPVAYRSYLTNAVRFCCIDQLRTRWNTDKIMYYEDPQIAVLTDGWSVNDDIEDLPPITQRSVNPEHVATLNDVDNYVIEVLRNCLRIMMVPFGSSSLLYLSYHWYIHRDGNIFRGLGQREQECITMCVSMTEVIFPVAKYLKVKHKQEEISYE